MLNLVKTAFTGAPPVFTPKSIIYKALKAAELKRGEKLYDLGSGTGRVLVMGVKEFGANATGFECLFPAFYLSKINFFINRIKNGTVCNKDMYRADIREADVIYLFLNPKAFKKLENKIRGEAKAGARIVTFSSPLPFWRPEKVIALEERENKIYLYLYRKPLA